MVLIDKPNYMKVDAIDSFRRAEKIITFDGGTANAIGDQSGTGNPATVFTVTGAVSIRVFGLCTTLLASAGGGTLELGTTTNTAKFIAQTTATAIDANEIWHDASPDASIELLSDIEEWIVTEDVEALVGTADIESGVIKFVCLWKPLSGDGNVVPA